MEYNSINGSINTSAEFEERDNLYSSFIDVLSSKVSLDIPGCMVLYIIFPSFSFSARMTTSAGRDVDSFSLSASWGVINNGVVTKAGNPTSIFNGENPKYQTASGTIPEATLAVVTGSSTTEICIVMNGSVNGDGSGFSSVTLTSSAVASTFRYYAIKAD